MTDVDTWYFKLW